MSLGPHCHVALLDLYRSKLPPGYTQDAFYFRPLLSSSPDGPWFSKQVYGHNTLGTTMKEMCLEAGIPVRSNHALCATAATRLFQSDVLEHMIQERTGHRSLKALWAYQTISVKQKEAASKALGTGLSYQDCGKAGKENQDQREEKDATSPTGATSLGANPSTCPLNFSNCTVNVYIGKQ